MGKIQQAKARKAKSAASSSKSASTSKSASKPSELADGKGRAFRRCGNGGSSTSTTSNNNAAKEFLNEFFALKLLGLHLGEINDEAAIDAAKPYEQIVCQVPLLQEFGSYLCEEAKTKRVSHFKRNYR